MTNMRIVSVKVRGELPESCHECRLTYRMEQEHGMERYCPFDDQNVELYVSRRFQWCPLVLEDKEGEG